MSRILLVEDDTMIASYKNLIDALDEIDRKSVV